MSAVHVRQSPRCHPYAPHPRPPRQHCLPKVQQVLIQGVQGLNNVKTHYFLEHPVGEIVG